MVNRHFLKCLDVYAKWRVGGKGGGEEWSVRLVLIFEKQKILTEPQRKHLYRVFIQMHFDKIYSEAFDQETKDIERLLLLYSWLKKDFKHLDTFFIFGS